MRTPTSAKRSNLLIGTSGWSYRSWRGPFFPRDLPEQGRLEFYAQQFRTTELNGVFYRTPTAEAVRGWEQRTPEAFIFAWKASRFITHWKRLNDTSRNSLALLEDRLRLLGKKAGPVLFQLPPQFEKDRTRLASFLRLLSPQRRYAFEFRHRSWYADDVLDLLNENGVALCISDHHEVAITLGNDRKSHIPARSRAPRAISRSILGRNAEVLGTQIGEISERRLHCLRLF